jgi:hypothetical protein
MPPDAPRHFKLIRRLFAVPALILLAFYAYFLLANMEWTIGADAQATILPRRHLIR